MGSRSLITSHGVSLTCEGSLTSLVSRRLANSRRLTHYTYRPTSCEGSLITLLTKTSLAHSPRRTRVSRRLTRKDSRKESLLVSRDPVREQRLAALSRSSLALYRVQRAKTLFPEFTVKILSLHFAVQNKHSQKNERPRTTLHFRLSLSLSRLPSSESFFFVHHHEGLFFSTRNHCGRG